VEVRDAADPAGWGGADDGFCFVIMLEASSFFYQPFAEMVDRRKFSLIASLVGIAAITCADCDAIDRHLQWHRTRNETWIGNGLCQDCSVVSICRL
jgi:hypothetical protein